MVDHPLRIATDTVDGNVTEGGITETLYDAIQKRTAVVLGPTESLGDYDFSDGSPPLAVISGATGYLYFYNADDTTTPDDGLTCLVTGDGKRYQIADASALMISSVLAIDNDPSVSPTVGDAYVVDTAPTGAWSAHAKDIALYTVRGWVFAQPQVGCALLNQETGLNIQYSAAGSWGAMATALDAEDVPPAALLFPMGLSVEAQQNAPPGSPSEGDYYLVGLAPSGDWAGHENDIAYYTATSVWAFLAAYDGARIFNKASDQELTWFDATGDWRPVWPVPAVTEGRLTLVTATPLPTSDQTAKATLYFTPYRGKNIALYVNGGWAMRQFSELSLSLAGYTSGKPYDIFAYDNAGVVALESLVWTDDTNRATAIAYQDGIPVKSGDPTRKYLGTIYTTATGQTEDSAAKRMVWNYWNRTRRSMRKSDTTTSWTYNGTTYRQARSNAGNQLEFVIGLAVEEVKATVAVAAIAGSGTNAIGGVGLDSTSSGASEVMAADVPSTLSGTIVADYGAVVAAGRHRLVWLERVSSGGVNATFYGTSGISGTIIN